MNHNTHHIAASWAIADLEECGINPDTHQELAQSLTLLYISLIGDQ